jgi:23S rRNA (adenine2030-N6)-methyltransferase
MFVINPPHTLKGALKDSLKQVALVLAQDQNNAFEVESGS